MGTPLATEAAELLKFYNIVGGGFDRVAKYIWEQLPVSPEKVKGD